jgi:hypothetical protein
VSTLHLGRDAPPAYRLFGTSSALAAPKAISLSARLYFDYLIAMHACKHHCRVLLLETALSSQLAQRVRHTQCTLPNHLEENYTLNDIVDLLYVVPQLRRMS